MSSSEYLICDSSLPLISSGKVKHELLLYNLDPQSRKELMDSFELLSGKKLEPDSLITQLSGGQQVLLMALIALLSPAPKIKFVNLMSSLDHTKRIALLKLIEESCKDIVMEMAEC